jgi:hypothetical protein
MKKLLFGSLLTIAAIAALAFAPFALAHQSNQAQVVTSTTANHHHTNLVVYEHSAHYKTIVVGTQQDPRGNYYVFDDPVYNNTDQHPIGFSEGLCTYTSKTITQCDWTLIFASGKITISGAALESDVVTTYAVTGGTGIYRQISGQVVLKYMKVGSQDEYKYDFDVEY